MKQYMIIIDMAGFDQIVIMSEHLQDLEDDEQTARLWGHYYEIYEYEQGRGYVRIDYRGGDD